MDPPQRGAVSRLTPDKGVFSGSKPHTLSHRVPCIVISLRAGPTLGDLPLPTECVNPRPLPLYGTFELAEVRLKTEAAGKPKGGVAELLKAEGAGRHQHIPSSEGAWASHVKDLARGLLPLPISKRSKPPRPLL